MTNPRIDIPLDLIEAFCLKWRVKELALFGAVLSQDFHSDSDVDVLVELHPGHGLTLYDWLDMIEELKRIFGRGLEIVAKGGIRNLFRRKEILQTAEVIHAA